MYITCWIGLILVDYFSDKIHLSSNLTPSFPITNFLFVFQVANDFRLARQSPNQTATVRCWILLWWADADVCLVDERCGRIHTINQHFHVRIDHHFIFIVITELESVVKENMRLDFIVIRIDDLISVQMNYHTENN